MRTAKEYRKVNKLTLRSEIRYCRISQRYLRRTCTLNQRTIITLHQVVFLVHCGYRCPDESCPGRSILYRNAAADALALPGFTDRDSM